MSQIEEEIVSSKRILTASEKLIDEGNELLKACTKKMHVPTFTVGQQKLELGLARKRKVEEEIKELEKQKAKYLKKK